MNVALHPRPSASQRAQPATAFNTISLCTGGGGLDLGLELAIPSTRAVVMVEREAFAVAHLVAAIEAGHMAPAALWSDVRTFNGRPWRGLVDGVIGGIPCQPHSAAGKRQGSLDERDLWSDARRIVAQCRPRLVLIENVSGMLSAGADQIAGAERVRRDLHRLGYAVEGGLFTAIEVGDSQERKRVFLLGVAGTGCAGLQGRERCASSGKRNRATASGSIAEFRALHLGNEPGERTRRLPDRREDGPENTDAGWAGPLFPPGPTEDAAWDDVIEHAPGLEPAICRMADGMANRVERLRMLGNGVVPLAAAYAIRTLILEHKRRGVPGADELAMMMEVA